MIIVTTTVQQSCYGHITTKAAPLIRTGNLNVVELHQYWVEWSPGNPECCSVLPFSTNLVPFHFHFYHNSLKPGVPPGPNIYRHCVMCISHTGNLGEGFGLDSKWKYFVSTLMMHGARKPLVSSARGPQNWNLTRYQGSEETSVWVCSREIITHS